MVKEILDLSNYNGELDKKILEPAAGVGNFVLEIIRRIIKTGRNNNLSNEEILNVILNNVYASEIDSDNYRNLTKNVSSLIKDELDINVTTFDNFKSTDSLRIV
jgi:predicted translin family RNA/ssDNA-binding protein